MFICDAERVNQINEYFYSLLILDVELIYNN